RDGALTRLERRVEAFHSREQHAELMMRFREARVETNRIPKRLLRSLQVPIQELPDHSADHVSFGEGRIEGQCLLAERTCAEGVVGTAVHRSESSICGSVAGVFGDGSGEIRRRLRVLPCDVRRVQKVCSLEVEIEGFRVQRTSRRQSFLVLRSERYLDRL